MKKILSAETKRPVASNHFHFVYLRIFGGVYILQDIYFKIIYDISILFVMLINVESWFWNCPLYKSVKIVFENTFNLRQFMTSFRFRHVNTERYFPRRLWRTENSSFKFYSLQCSGETVDHNWIFWRPRPRSYKVINYKL